MSASDIISVGIVGAGRAGSAILTVLSELSSVKVAGMIDVNPDAPGLDLARDRGVPVYDSLDDLLAQPLTIVIEATGLPHIAELIAASKQPETSLADSAVVRVMRTLVESHMTLERELADRAEVLSVAATQLTGTVGRIGESSEEVAQGAARVADEATRATEALDSASQVLQATDQVLEFVRKVAASTNLLGLNAAIEAARAGDHGRGFAVVAEEVRRLAEDSSKSADEIGQIVRDVNQFLRTTIAAITTVAGIAREQAASTVQAAQAAGQIIDAVGSLSQELARLSTLALARDQLISGTAAG